jgi:hypothetical protein
MSQMLILAVHGGGDHDAPTAESRNPAISEIAFFGRNLTTQKFPGYTRRVFHVLDIANSRIGGVGITMRLSPMPYSN